VIQRAGLPNWPKYKPQADAQVMYLNAKSKAEKTTARAVLIPAKLWKSNTESSYVFCREVLGYDVAAFFQRNSKQSRRNLRKF